jgi:hypothetical protein
VGASTGAYVYPLGRPDLKVGVGLDGSYRLAAVPTSVGALILFDGAPFPLGRAERVDVELDGGELNRLDDRFGGGAPVDDSLRMPLAGAVLATVSVDGGATIKGPSFSVLGTEHEGLSPASGSQETIYPLPPGTWDVSASLSGFKPAQVQVQVVQLQIPPGLTVAAALPLEIDLVDPTPGCAALPGCDGGLTCDVSTGRCY